MSLLTELVVETGRRSYKHSVPSGLLKQLLSAAQAREASSPGTA